MNEAFDELTLIRSAQNGALAAFNRLVLAYQGLAYNVAYRILGDADAASDATQDSFLKAYRALSQFRGGSFKSWLMRIVTNVCYDQIRHRRRRPAESLDALLTDPDHAPVLINGREGPESHALRAELSQVLQAAIGLLPADQRITLILSDVQGLSYEEIAETMDVSLGTVKSRLSRGRAKLRDLLRRHQELLPSPYRLTSE